MNDYLVGLLALALLAISVFENLMWMRASRKCFDLLNEARRRETVIVKLGGRVKNQRSALNRMEQCRRKLKGNLQAMHGRVLFLRGCPPPDGENAKAKRIGWEEERDRNATGVPTDKLDTSSSVRCSVKMDSPLI